MPDVEYLYMFVEDFYRLGNASSPRLDHVRDRDIEMFDRNSVVMVRSNGFGISLYNQARLEKESPTGWIWKILKSTPMPVGLALQPDLKPGKQGHYFLCPATDMSLDKYRGLLTDLALRCERVRKQ